MKEKTQEDWEKELSSLGLGIEYYDIKRIIEKEKEKSLEEGKKMLTVSYSLNGNGNIDFKMTEEVSKIIKNKARQEFKEELIKDLAELAYKKENVDKITLNALSNLIKEK